jgi:glycopeptide antibiotics resistance protein
LGQIAGFVGRMLAAMLLVAPVILVLRLAGVRRLARRGLSTTWSHEAGLWLFLLFCAGLAALTVVPGEKGWSFPDPGRINLVPFAVFRQSLAIFRAGGGWGYFLINFVGNIVMFAPLGFFPPLLWRLGRGRLWISVGAALGASLFVEVCQLFQNRGTDVDDLWLNALGGVLGFALYLLIEKAAPEAAEGCKVRDRRRDFGEGKEKEE